MWATLYLRKAVKLTDLRRSFARAFHVDAAHVRLFGLDPDGGADLIRLMVVDEKPPAFPVEVIVTLDDRMVPGDDEKLTACFASLARSLGTPILVDLNAEDQYRYADPSGVVIGVMLDDDRLDTLNEIELSEESRAELAKAIAAAA